MNTIRERAGGPYKFLAPETAEHLASLMSEASWNSRIELAMRGEPSMNPDRDAIVAVLRQHLPRASIMMTSNGGGFLKGDVLANIDGIFDAGLNCLALDNYDGISIVDRIVDAVKDYYSVYHYPDDTEANPYRRRHRTARDIVVMPDIQNTKDGVHNAKHVHNQAGSAGPLDESFNDKRCARPFREFVVTYDGTVTLCCNDWKREFKVGNIRDYADIEELWYHPAMEAVRKHLYHYNRGFGRPCNGCTSTSKRVGLMPDAKGEYSMPKPSDSDDAHIEAITKQELEMS